MASTLDSLPSNGTFDPYSQDIIITMPDGHTRFAASISTIFDLQNMAVIQAVLFGIQIGLSVLLMTILGLMTKADKRRSIVFILNLASLLFIFIRGVVQCVQFTGVYYNYYNWAAAYYPNIEQGQSQSIGLEVLSFIVIMLIELSLVFQVRIVCCTLARPWRLVLDITSVMVVLAAVGVRFGLMMVNILYGVVHINTASRAQRGSITTMQSASNITLMISITFFSAIFCTKLGHAIMQRRKMGMKSFGPMQIIFVMGCQTLVVPVIFGIISYWILPGSQIYAMMPAVVATFLPLSSIWASTNTQNNVNIAAPNQWHDRKHASTGRGNMSRGYSSEKGLLPSTVTTDCTLVDDRGNSVSSPSTQKADHYAPRERDSIDLEMQRMGRSIRVDRGYSVRSD